VEAANSVNQAPIRQEACSGLFHGGLQKKVNLLTLGSPRPRVPLVLLIGTLPNFFSTESMPRGGYREGAGRKKEYQEPVKKILLGLPQSVLEQLDDFARQHNLSRPKAVAALLRQAQAQEQPVPPKRAKMLEELKSLKMELHRN